MLFEEGGLVMAATPFGLATEEGHFVLEEEVSLR
jgi:hypothetical protein